MKHGHRNPRERTHNLPILVLTQGSIIALDVDGHDLHPSQERLELLPGIGVVGCPDHLCQVSVHEVEIPSVMADEGEADGKAGYADDDWDRDEADRWSDDSHPRRQICCGGGGHRCAGIVRLG